MDAFRIKTDTKCIHSDTIPGIRSTDSSFRERRFTIQGYLFVVILVVHLQSFLALLLFHRIVQEHADKH